MSRVAIKMKACWVTGFKLNFISEMRELTFLESLAIPSQVEYASG